MIDESGSMSCNASHSPAKEYLDKLMNRSSYNYFEVVMKYLQESLGKAIEKS